VVVAPTQDHQQVTRAVQDLKLDAGTAIGEAVLSSLGSLDLVPGSDGQAPPPARIVLLSDGTNTVGRPVSQAVQAAKDAHVPVSTIAFGTQTGTVVVDGNTIAVPVDRDALKGLADDTGGKSYTAESAQALSGVYSDIGSQVGTTKEPREVTARFTGLGLLLAAGAAVLGLVWGTRIP
jgi:Ca-activated chloride channel family protein